MRRPSTGFVVCGVLGLLVLAGAWILRHRYEGIGSGGKTLVRTNRWTGSSDILRGDGWEPIPDRLAPRALPPDVADMVDSTLDEVADGKLRVRLHNGSTWDVTGCIIERRVVQRRSCTLLANEPRASEQLRRFASLTLRSSLSKEEAHELLTLSDQLDPLTSPADAHDPGAAPAATASTPQAPSASPASATHPRSDLSRVSTEDLVAYKRGDLSMVSPQGLIAIQAARAESGRDDETAMTDPFLQKLRGDMSTDEAFEELRRLAGTDVRKVAALDELRRRHGTTMATEAAPGTAVSEAPPSGTPAEGDRGAALAERVKARLAAEAAGRDGGITLDQLRAMRGVRALSKASGRAQRKRIFEKAIHDGVLRATPVRYRLPVYVDALCDGEATLSILMEEDGDILFAWVVEWEGRRNDL